jgi:hypothetical protein
MREILALKLPDAMHLWTGDAGRVKFDYFQMRKFILTADRRFNEDAKNDVSRDAKSDISRKVPLVFIHSHPPGIDGLSTDDRETMIGLRYGLDRDFTFILVTNTIALHYEVLWRNKTIVVNACGKVKHGQYQQEIEEVRRLSCYD